MPADQPRALSVGFVPGVTPGKWVARWRERHPAVPLEPSYRQAAPGITVQASNSTWTKMSILRDLFHRLGLETDDLVCLEIFPRCLSALMSGNSTMRARARNTQRPANRPANDIG